MSDRRDIVTKMNLVEGDEWQLLEPERYGRALIRASERKQLDELAQEVASKENNNG